MCVSVCACLCFSFFGAVCVCVCACACVCVPESIAEAALCKSVLKPLRESIYLRLETLHSEDGSTQRLALNQVGSLAHIHIYIYIFMYIYIYIYM